MVTTQLKLLFKLLIICLYNNMFVNLRNKVINVKLLFTENDKNV